MHSFALTKTQLLHYSRRIKNGKTIKVLVSDAGQEWILYRVYVYILLACYSILLSFKTGIFSGTLHFLQSFLATLKQRPSCIEKSLRVPFKRCAFLRYFPNFWIFSWDSCLLGRAFSVGLFNLPFFFVFDQSPFPLLFKYCVFPKLFMKFLF